MKITRFLALATIALLVVGAMGMVSFRSFAQAPTPPAAQSQDCNTHEADDTAEAAEKAGVADSDAIENECGDQVEDGQPDGPEDGGADVQEPVYGGSIMVDQAVSEKMTEAEETSALQSLATISASDAEAAARAANPDASVVETELDNENGALVYSVELSTGVEVKVDAGNAAVLHTEPGESPES